MKNFHFSGRVAGLSILAGAALTGVAQANMTVTGPAGAEGFLLTATNAAGISSWPIPISAFTAEPFAGLPSLKYVDPTDITLSNGAVIRDLNLRYVGDPQILWNFTVSAGATDTTFTVTSGLMNFTTIAGVSGFVTTGVSLVDSTAGGNGVAYTGLYAGGKSYLANYNGALPGGSIFTMLQPSFATAGGSANQTGNGVAARFPSPSGNAAVAGTVSSMQVEFNFKLSADDQMGTTNNYKLTPSPGTALIVGFGGLLSMGRRRR